MWRKKTAAVRLYRGKFGIAAVVIAVSIDGLRHILISSRHRKSTAAAPQLQSRTIAACPIRSIAGWHFPRTKAGFVTSASRAPFGLRGLSSDEVELRLAAGRGNAVTWAPSRSFKRIAADNALSPVNVVLFLISGVLIVLGLFVDAILTGGLVLANVAVGVFQEARAKRQLERIALLHRPQASVVRDGAEREVQPEQVVEGDVLIIRPGDQILVDGPVLISQGIGVDESLLTGEADIALKREGDPLVSGSFCVAGTGAYEAKNVGSNTVATEITTRAREHRAPSTPLQKEVGLVIGVMSLVVVFLGAEVFRSFRDSAEGVPFSETVRAAAVIVALVPQGLAVMVTVSYALAAVRMGGSGVLVQRMNAVESISHVDALCVDKTGTITTNRLNVEALVPLEAGGEAAAALLGDYAASAAYSNHTLDSIRATFPGTFKPVRQEIPFDSSRKWSALAMEGPDMRGLYVLGAPEVMAAHCADPARIEGRAEGWAKQGLRVLLFAQGGDGEAPGDHGGQPELPDHLRPLGLVILRDELRPDAHRVITELAASGIDVKIISGDHVETIAALATQAGIAIAGDLVSGAEIEGMNEKELERVVVDSTIFGRVSPQGKAELVRALQRTGRYVAMIGDGVNDIPALKAAQVAVAMRGGSGIARSVADLVLLRDEFSKLPSLFQEGRRIRKGMDSIFRLFLTRTLSLTLIVLFTSLLNDPFPITPRHSALIALLTVGIPSLGVAIWARPDKTGRVIVLSGAGFVLPAALGIAGIGLIVYEFYISAGDVEQARSALTMASVLCGLLLILFLEPPTPAWTGARPLSGDWRPVLLGGIMLLAFGAVLTLPGLRRFFELETPNIWGFLIIVLVVFAWATALRFTWRLEPMAGLRKQAGRIRFGLPWRRKRGRR